MQVAEYIETPRVDQEVLQGFRISPQQEHLWIQQQAGQSKCYHASCAVMLDGFVDVDKLKASFERVIRRHEILRTSFRCLPGMRLPVQVINESSAFSFEQLDLRGLETLERSNFDYSHGPVLHVCLVRLGAAQSMLLITLPSLYTDQQGMGNLVREVSRDYGMLDHAEAFEVPAIQYADVAEIFHSLLEGDDTETGREYWRQWRSAERGVLSLAGQSRKESGAFAPERFELEVSEELQERVGGLAREFGTSEELVLLASWQTLLWRLSNGQEVVIGKQAAGRSYGLETALGLFEKYLPLRAVVEEGKQFRELLQRTRAQVEELEKWQEYFSWGAESGESYLAVGFEYQEQSAAWQAGGVRWQVTEQYACTEGYELKLVCVGQGGRAQKLELHYDGGRYEAGGVRVLGAQYEQLLASVSVEPEAALEQLGLVNAAEREQLLREQQGSVSEYPQQCVHELFEAQVRERPEAIAVVSGAEQLSYRELNERANEVAVQLQGLGVGPEQLVRAAGAVSGVAGGVVGDPESWGRLSAAGPGLSTRAAALHGAGCAGAGAVGGPRGGE